MITNCKKQIPPRSKYRGGKWRLSSLTVVLLVFFVVAAFFNIPQAHAASTVSITITSSPGTGSGFVTVDGQEIVTPATFTWNVGGNHTIAANSTFTIVPEESRYNYSDWSDQGAQSHTITVPPQQTTYTANFQLQYFLKVSGGFSTTGQGWYNNGTIVTASSNSVQTIQGNVTGLVGLWNFDGDTGSVAYDSSGNGNNGTIFGATSVQGKFGDALSFNGVSNYVQLSSLIHAPKTVSFWIKTSDSSDVQSVVSTVNGEEYIYGVFNGKAFYGWHESAWNEITSSASVATGNWVYVAFVYDSNDNMNIYINGVLDSAFPTNFGNTENGNFTRFGDSSYTLWGLHQMFKGSLDDVRIYNRTLDLSEIQSLYYYRMAVAYWQQLDGVNQTSNYQNTTRFNTAPIVMNAYHSVTFLSAVSFDVKLKVVDDFGNPVPGARAIFTLTNGATVKSTTGSDGTLNLESVPKNFNATVQFLGGSTEVSGDASTESTITVRVFASYATLSIIAGGIATVAVSFTLVRLYRRSPAFQANIKRSLRFIFRKNCGMPFFAICVIFLLFTAVALSVGLSSLANSVSIYAYFFLIIGAVLQLIHFLIYRKLDVRND